MNGDRWKLADGREALEVGKVCDCLKLAVIDPTWPFPAPPILIPRSECTKMGSRYHQGAILDECEEAPL
jgi:hypothetical protein